MLKIELSANDPTHLAKLVGDLSLSLNPVPVTTEAPIESIPVSELLDRLNSALQAQGLCATVQPLAGQETCAPAPKKTRAKKTETPPEEVKVDLEPEPAVEEEAAEIEVTEMSDEDIKAKAIAILTDLYTRGDEARDKVLRIRDSYGVPKLGAVPEHLAQRLLDDALALSVELEG